MYVYVMAITSKEITELKVGFDENPFIYMFSIYKDINPTVTLLTVSNEMTYSQAVRTLELLEQIPQHESSIGVMIPKSNFRWLHNISQLEEILEVIGDSTEVMKSASDFDRMTRSLYEEAVEERRMKLFYTDVKKFYEEDFVSTGNAQADELILKIRKI